MAAPKTVLTYPLNGTMKDFTIPFEYLARKFVTVTLRGATKRTLVLNSEYRFTTKTTITTTSAWGPAQGFDSIEIRRVTSATERLVDFSDGSILRAYDLNTSQVQSLHIAEEARDLTADTIGVNNDGNLDARSRRIVNLADAIDPGDAVTLRQNQQWAGSALNQANASQASAVASYNYRVDALASRDAALAYRDSAYAYRTDAMASKDAAAASAASANTSNQEARAWATNSQNSAMASATSASQAAQKLTDTTAQADRARTEADRAKTEADKLGGMNDMAANIESTGIGAGNWNISFKGIVSAIGNMIAKRFKASAYDEGIGFANQYGTDAPFVTTPEALPSASAYRPIVKGRYTLGGNQEALSLGVLSYPGGNQSAVIHWGTNGTGGGSLLTLSRENGKAEFIGPVYAPALFDNGSRVWSSANWNPATKLSGNGGVGNNGTYNSVNGVNYQNLPAANQVYNGALEIRENGLVGNGGPAPGHIYNAPSIAFHWGATVVNKLMMNSSGNLCWGNPSGDPVRIDVNGIIYGSAYGGTLSGWVDTYYTPRGGFAAQAVASINAGTLGNVAFLQNNSGAAKGNNDVLGGGSLNWSSHNSVLGAVGGGSWRCNGWSNHGGVACWQRIA